VTDLALPVRHDEDARRSLATKESIRAWYDRVASLADDTRAAGPAR